MQCGTASAYPGQVMPFVSLAGIAIFFGQNLVAKFEIHFTPAKREIKQNPWEMYSIIQIPNIYAQ